MTTPQADAPRQIRHARWLLEQAGPAITDTPGCHEALEEARQLLGQIGGDYREGEVIAFAAVEQQRTTSR